ncbi:MAG: hypothetical protein ACREQZ_08850, partial [Woeseiaceae bacterium]
DLRHEKGPVSIWQRLGYFFLFPNVCFPLFPVVDYQTYKRTYYDRPALEIYQKGIDWIFRGIVHLLLYRVVYHYFVPDPLEIQNVAGVAQYVLSSFLLYLRVSGLFHLIIGILCLFGCNLPETHHRYYLANSFTDFWRRINIYWKDFMMKLFYFPIYLSIRRWGLTLAMILATLATFFITWLLHSYQWFWLRGTFTLHPQDMIFWGILAVLVTANSLYEEKYGRKRKSLTKREQVSVAEALKVSAKTVSVFIFISILWSFWTSSSIDRWISVMSVLGSITVMEFVTCLLLVAVVIAAGVVLQLLSERQTPLLKRDFAAVPYRAAWVGASAVALLAVANPLVSARLNPQLEGMVATITGDQLNTRDQQELVKGYYEGLLGAESSGAMVWSVHVEKPETWRWNGDREVYHVVEVDDIRDERYRPFIDAIDKGQEFRTNRWGMRDKDYEKEKAPGTFRIAMLGSSHTVGSGVAVESTFPSLMEAQLNEGASSSPYGRVEILNFAYGGDSILRRLARLQKEALDFDIDAVIDMSITGEHHLAVRQLRIAVKNNTPELDPFILDVIRRSEVSPDLSDDEIERRLAQFGDEIIAWAYRELARTAESNGVQALVVVLPRVEDTNTVYRDEWHTLSRFAEQAGLAAINLENVYGPINSRSFLKLASWDWHPNAKAHELLAKQIHQQLNAINFAPSSTSRSGGSAGSNEHH